MSLLSNLVFVSAIAGVAVFGLVMLKAKSRSPGSSLSDQNAFKPKRLVTANELEFLGRLEAAAPELRFHVQVAMGALLEPSASRSDTKRYYRLRGMFSQKIVDFVAQDRLSGEVVAVIELDDRTHQQVRDAKRDQMLTSAGYRIVRWNSNAKPDAHTIRLELIQIPVAEKAVPISAAGENIPPLAPSPKIKVATALRR